MTQVRAKAATGALSFLQMAVNKLTFLAVQQRRLLRPVVQIGANQQLAICHFAQVVERK